MHVMQSVAFWTSFLHLTVFQQIAVHARGRLLLMFAFVLKYVQQNHLLKCRHSLVVSCM